MKPSLICSVPEPPVKTLFRRYRSLLFTAGLAVLLDEISQQFLLRTLPLEGDSIAPIPALLPFFRFTRSHNTGSAFGFLSGAGDLFTVIAIVIISILVITYPRIPAEQRWNRLAIGLICGGALGNLFDRIEFGYVLDFIHYQIPGVISNVSNLADHAIVFGVLLYLVGSWRAERREQRSPSA